jgi:aryl-alcohol dehydrogenase-like predicted oxidoreductase
MEYRQLGRCGARVSVIGLGTNRFGSEALPQESVNRIFAAAADLGVNFVDTANSYTDGKSEESIGNALQGRREKFFVATKFFYPLGDGPNDRGTSRLHMMNALELSLRRLRTDRVDLYYVHRWDDATPIEETLRALDDLIRAGKIRYVGASAFASWQLAHANLLAEVRGWSPFVVIQSHFHMFEREVQREVLPYCRQHRVGFIPFFPLAGGFLTGKYRRGQPPPPGSRGEKSGYVQRYMTEKNYDVVEKLVAWAGERGRALNELAQAWLLAQPTVCSVISGATKLDHVLSNVKAADWSLTPDETREIEAILDGPGGKTSSAAGMWR